VSGEPEARGIEEEEVCPRIDTDEKIVGRWRWAVSRKSVAGIQ